MIATRCLPSLLLATCLALPLSAQQTARAADQAAIDRTVRHATVEWATLAPHMPDPATGTVASLEMAADVLRARRMPEDALDYYTYALQRGGNAARLHNLIGVTQLQLHQPEQARASFRKALLLDRKDAEAWNNLGAAEYLLTNFQAAISDYRRAVKVDKKVAVFHSNLGTAYFERSDYESARKQFETAVKLDPGVFDRVGWGGVQAHVLSPKDRGRFCFEMAKVAAHNGDDESVLRWLGHASETGFDVAGEMRGDKDFDGYRKDDRITLLLKNARAMRTGQLSASGAAPALPADKVN